MPQTLPQAAVLAVREGLVCLVTSRDGMRWVLPKGHIEDGHTPAEAAAREAWEEAGLTGDVEPEPIGNYSYQKNGCLHEVVVFRMVGVVEANRWPEKLVRRRRWVTIGEAAKLCSVKSLRLLLVSLDFSTASTSK